MINFEIVPTEKLIKLAISNIRCYSTAVANHAHYMKYTTEPKMCVLERHYFDMNLYGDCADILLRELETRNANVPERFMKQYLFNMHKRESILD